MRPVSTTCNLLVSSCYSFAIYSLAIYLFCMSVCPTFIMAALCGHYIFALWFLFILLSFFFFFSSPNLSRRRLDVYHTSTHGVALVRIYDACLKRGARGSLKAQDAKIAKNPHLGTIAQLCRAISSELRHVSTIGKNLLNSNTSSTCIDDMVNFGPVYITTHTCIVKIKKKHHQRYMHTK